MKQSALSFVCVVLAALAAAPAMAKDSSFALDREQIAREWQTGATKLGHASVHHMKREVLAQALSPEVLAEQIKLVFADSNAMIEMHLLAFQENEQGRPAP